MPDADKNRSEAAYVADELDRAILRNLQLDARRPFSAMAADLGVSDQTVARRYQRLRARAGVRVSAIIEPDTGDQWLFRLRVRTGAEVFATTLADRDDSAWVSLVVGPDGPEITMMMFQRRSGVSPFALLERLAALSNVVSATAQSCPFVFFGGRGNLLVKSESAPAPPSAPIPPEPSWDAAPDARLLAALTVDGRTSVRRLSEVSGLAPETVTQRLADMQERGTVYFDVDFDPVLLGLRKTFSLWAAVTPRHLAEAGAALASHPQISFACATTGVTNLYAVAHCVDDADVYRYLSGPLGDLPGLRSTETAPQMRTLKTMHRHAPV